MEVHGSICTFVFMIYFTLAACFAFPFSISNDGNIPEKGKERKKVEWYIFEWLQGLTERFVSRGRGKKWMAFVPCMWSSHICGLLDSVLMGTWLYFFCQLISNPQYSEKIRLNNFMWNYQILVPTVYLPWGSLDNGVCGHTGISDLFPYPVSLIHFCLLSTHNSSWHIKKLNKYLLNKWRNCGSKGFPPGVYNSKHILLGQLSIDFFFTLSHESSV